MSIKDKAISKRFSTKKKHYKINEFCFFFSIRMSEKTLKFDDIRVNKKEFQKSKQPFDLDLVNVNQIVVSDKFKQSDGGFSYWLQIR